jgi:hypothetical protein
MNDPEFVVLLARLQEHLESVKVDTMQGQLTDEQADMLAPSLTRLIDDMEKVTPLTGPSGHKPEPAIKIPTPVQKLKFK